MWGLSLKASITLLAASNTKNYAPNSISQITSDFRDFCTTLGEKATVYSDVTPTIRFSFVTPPLSSSDDDWWNSEVLQADADLMTTMTTSNNTIFQAVTERHGMNKPVALYLPGLDGYGISTAPYQFNDLSKTFELWRMSVKTDDRSSFSTLVQTVSSFIDDLSMDGQRPIYIIGESFGGLLAPAVTLKLHKREQRVQKKNPINGLVMVNPTTSFDESNWDILAQLLTTVGKVTELSSSPFNLPSPYSVASGLIMSTLIPSQKQKQQLIESIRNTNDIQNPSLQQLPKTIEGSLNSLKLTAEVLPVDTLDHRIKNWLMVGSQVLLPRLEQLTNIPTMLIVGSDDNFLNSPNEVRRLQNILPKCEKLEVKGGGHFVLADANVNLTEAILFSKLDPLNFKETIKPYDPVLDWELPEQEVIDEIYEQSVKPLETAFSPIFISTNEAGERSMGLKNIPRNDGPLLFVSNHQLLGVDLNFLISTLLYNDIVVRGLAHPIAFQGSTNQRGELGGRVPGIIENEPSSSGRSNGGTSNFQKFGALMVTPRNYYRVLQSGQNALLFPGGIREVFHGRDEAYKLFWPEKVDFVRTAARFNATIIPISAVGMADSLNIILEPNEVQNLPLGLGNRAKEFSRNVTSARFDVSNEDENFLPPIVAPTLPSRNYFIFGKPYETSTINPKDKIICEKTYEAIKNEMNRGFHDILHARQKDPYKDAAPRLTYERLIGKQAPTFEISEVNIKQK